MYCVGSYAKTRDIVRVFSDVDAGGAVSFITGMDLGYIKVTV